jgi:hypothetical protein
MLYVSFGMRKAGSTFAFEMTKEILEQNGMPQKRLPGDIIDQKHKINYVAHFSDEVLEQLITEVEAIGYPIVIKTHQRPSRGIANMIRSGKVIGQASYRDPRDIALSLVDAGRHARERGRQAFSEFYNLHDTVRTIGRQIEWLEEWLELPGIMPIYYEDMAFDTEPTTRRVAAQFDLPVDAAQAKATVTSSRFTQFNKGVSQRHLEEMSEEDRVRLNDLFGDFIDRYCGSDREKQPRRTFAA